MNVYAVAVLAHVGGAVALLGGSLMAAPAVRAAARKAHTVQELQAYLAIGRPLLVLEPAAAVVVLATGLYLTREAGFWGLGWVQVAIVFWLVNAVVAGALVKPILSRLASAAGGALDGPVNQALDEIRWSRRWSVGGDLLLANDAAVLYLMVMKPGLPGALLTVAVANLVPISVRAVRRGYRRPAVPTSQEIGVSVPR